MRSFKKIVSFKLVMINSEFFNTLSSNYDEMINFKNSLQNKIESLNKIIEPDYKTALDLGCGTGVDSIALSHLGLTVDTVDHSAEMINLAKQNSRKYNAQINFQVSDLTEIKLSKKYDLIVSLGNTLANIRFDNVSKIISSAAQSLNSSGKILIQIINFSNIPRDKEFILNTFENDKVKIIRKYTFEKDEINFVIDITNENKSKSISTKMFPHSLSEFQSLAKQNSININIYSNLQLEQFKDNSKDLVICFSK